VSEDLDGTLTLRGQSRDFVGPAAAFVTGVGAGDALARALIEPPRGFVGQDGLVAGPAEWFYDNWGCKRFHLDDGMWWEEPARGDGDSESWACWNLTTTNGVPHPILCELSSMFPELKVAFCFEEYVGGDEMFRLRESIWQNSMLIVGDR